MRASKHQQSGIRQGLALIVDAHWSPQQAMAVMEMLDDLRELIAAHYQPALQELMQQERQYETPIDSDPDPF